MSTETVEHIHRHIPSDGSVTIKVEKNSRGVNYEIRIERPIAGTSIDTGLAILMDIAALQRAINENQGEVTGVYPLKVEG